MIVAWAMLATIAAVVAGWLLFERCAVQSDPERIAELEAEAAEAWRAAAWWQQRTGVVVEMTMRFARIAGARLPWEEIDGAPFDDHRGGDAA